MTINIDTLAPGTFPYEAGLCLGVHNIDWSPRNKSRDPSYIASPDFVTNNNIELNLFGNHLPDAEPLALVSGTIWRVEAKNSTTDYDSVGFGSLMNNLHIGFITPSTILEQKILGVESVSGHKDTPMLVVGWGEYADLREWDKPHLNRTFLDENESESCWAIAIKNLNRFYGGNLTLDEIRWYAKKETMSNKDSIHAFLFGGNAAQTSAEIQTGLKYALDSIMNFQSISKISINELMEYIKQDHVIYVSTKGHAMLIDGFFKTTNDVYFRYINIDNLGTSGIFSPNNLFDQHTRFIIIDTPKSIRNMDPLLGVEKFDNFNKWIEWTDSDNDGITDFDEVYRFGTNPYSADSDSDGVADKDEIHSYTLMENSKLNLTGTFDKESTDLSRIRFIAGIESEYMADVDNDGLRAELDNDSDGDSLLDGIDPTPYTFNRNIEPLNENILPKDIILYARKILKINDGTLCENKQEAILCNYVSEDTESDYGIIMGARAGMANLYAQNNVFIRSNPSNTFFINYYGPDSLATTRPDKKLTFEKHFRTTEWPWKLNINLPYFDDGDSILVVHQGDTCILRDDDHFKVLKVESGGFVILPNGNIYVDDLQLEAGSNVQFENNSCNTNLYVKRNILWRAQTLYKKSQGFSYDCCAENFRLFYYGKQNVFFDTNWYGTIIAPNAKIVLGQTSNKTFYGQFYANEIVVHQYSDLKNIPFLQRNAQLEYVLNLNNPQKVK